MIVKDLIEMLENVDGNLEVRTPEGQEMCCITIFKNIGDNGCWLWIE